MKRLFDVMVSLVGILILAPLMLAISVIIKFRSVGPILYKQQRVGWHEALFNVYKFRTMVDKADTMGSSVTTGIDPRITPVGRFLRKTKLDELPQLFNVLKGEMSFVGPRPDTPDIIAKYTPEMREIFAARPGITSVATLHFRDEEDILARVTEPDKFYKEIVVPLKVELAMEHVRKNSFWFDLSILCQTFWVLTPLGKIWPVKELQVVKRFKEKYLLNTKP